MPPMPRGSVMAEIRDTEYDLVVQLALGEELVIQVRGRTTVNEVRQVLFDYMGTRSLRGELWGRNGALPRNSALWACWVRPGDTLRLVFR